MESPVLEALRKLHMEYKGVGRKTVLRTLAIKIPTEKNLDAVVQPGL